MRISLVVLVVAICFPPTAHASWCQHEAELSAEMDLSGVDRIEVLALSGDLRVTGRSGLSRVRVDGRACVSDEERERLDEIAIVEERDGATLRVIAKVPYSNDRGSRIGGLDLRIDVPDTVPLYVNDSSGSTDIENVDSLELEDSSGSVDIRRVAGSVLVTRDSSGELEIDGAGDVEIRQDTSGKIDVSNARSLRIGRDSSGAIIARDIDGDVLVGKDTSGSIKVERVGGDFVVESDSSGGISYRDVAGSVRIPEQD